jgi:Ca2+-binding EF-hand superfamily protein
MIMTKGKMKAFLSRRFKGRIAQCITKGLDIYNTVNLESYCQIWEDLLNHNPEKLLKIAFQSFDFNKDKYICELDLYSIMKIYEAEDHVCVDSFS